jgi:cytoskeletal protein CcmA (bactofilin family)
VTAPGTPGADPAGGAPLVELNALLGRGTSYAGKLHFDGRVRIEGRFEGEIRGEDVLVIGDGAEVDGDIEVGVCIVTGGTVRAQIRARDAIELHAPAVVHGDLHAPNVFIDRGVQFEGNCKMAPLDDEGGTSTPLTQSAAAATDREADLASTPTEDELVDERGVEPLVDEPTAEINAGVEGGGPQPEAAPVGDDVPGPDDVV